MPSRIAQQRADFADHFFRILLAHHDHVGEPRIVGAPDEERGAAFADAGDQQLVAAAHLLHVGDVGLADGDAGHVVDLDDLLLADAQADGAPSDCAAAGRLARSRATRVRERMGFRTLAKPESEQRATCPTGARGARHRRERPRSFRPRSRRRTARTWADPAHATWPPRSRSPTADRRRRRRRAKSSMKNGHPAAAPETAPERAISFTSPAPIQLRSIMRAKGPAQTSTPSAESASSENPPNQTTHTATIRGPAASPY